MRPGRLLLITCLSAAWGGLLQAKPPTLDEFWMQWNQQHLDPETKEGLRFVRSYALQWNPSIIPALIRDTQAARGDEAGMRDHLYAFAVLYIPDRAGCKAVIAKIRASPGAKTQMVGQSNTTDAIASDFQSAIDDIETGQETLPDLN